MSIEAGPPPQPPQLSPDHKWVWDGAQWRPLAVHQAIFPNWQGVGAGLPPEPAAAVAPVRMPVLTPPPMPAPPPVYRVAAPEPEPVPLWKQQRPSNGINNILYVVAGFIVLVIIGVLINAFGPTSLPWQTTNAGHPTASPTPPLTQRSDSARAQRFVNGLLAPPMGDLEQSLTILSETCNVPLRSSCADALITTDNQANGVLAVIDHETLPVCVAGNVTRIRSDLVKMDAGVQQALKGVKDARTSEVTPGLGQVAGAKADLHRDNAALNSAAASCDAQPTGP